MHHFSPRAEGLIPMHQFFLTISRCDQNYQGEIKMTARMMMKMMIKMMTRMMKILVNIDRGSV